MFYLAYAESIRSLCLSTYLPEEVAKLNKMAEMRSGKKLDMALPSDYLTVSGICFINQSSPVMTISKNGIRFSKACHSRLDDCEYVELLYHPILQVVILRKSNHGSSTAMHWRDKSIAITPCAAEHPMSFKVPDKLLTDGQCRMMINGIQFIQVLLEANGLAAGKDHQFKGRYDAEKNAVIISLEKDEQSALSPQKCTT